MHLQFIWLRALSACSVLMFPLAAFATDIPGGQIDGRWTLAGSPYVIRGDVTVGEGTTLIIDPGVQVLFAGANTLNISGTLIAIGGQQEKDNIVFTSSSLSAAPVAATLKFTKSISFDGGAVFNVDGTYISGSILEHVVVKNIGGLIPNGAVVLFGAHPYIHNSKIYDNGASGIYAYSIEDDLRIENNVIERNSAIVGGGLHVTVATSSARVTLRGNTVRNNTASQDGGGLYFLGSPGNTMDSFVLSGNTIQANNAADGGGIYTHSVSMTMTADSVRDNSSGSGSGGGLKLKQSQVTFTKSMILHNRSLKMGGGIFLDGGTYRIGDSVLAMNESESAHGGGIDMHGLPDVTIDYSVVANNKAPDYGSAVSMTEGICKVINSAIVANELANAIGVFKITTLEGNTIAYNSAASPSQFLSGTIAFNPKSNDADVKLNMVGNNIFRNATPYDVVTYYDGAITAQSNWWGTTDEIGVGGRIALVATGAPTVDFSGLLSGPNISAPISPPSSFTAIPTATSVKLKWSANPESDTQGYKVYWGDKPFPDYEHVIDVASATSYEIQSVISGSGFVAVTAYDNDYLAMNDDAATPVNENQTRGHESWYALPSHTVAIVSTDPEHKKNGDVVSFKITVTNAGPSVGNDKFIVTHTISSGLAYYYMGVVPQLPNQPPTICTLVSANQVTCTHDPIAANTSTEIIIQTLVNTADRIDIVSTAEVHPLISGTETNQAQVTLHVNAPDVAVLWSRPPTAQVGEPVNYQVTVKNHGPVSAFGTGLDITIPASFTINLPLDSRCTAVESARIACKLGDLTSNDKAGVSMAFNMTGSTPGEFVLLATVASTGDSDAKNNDDRLTTTIIGSVQGNADAGADVSSYGSGNKKKGGGVLDLEWLLMFAPLFAARRRFRFFAAVT